MTIRSFIAIPIPQAMADALGDVAAQMSYQDKSNAVRWVDQGNYHLTLAFLGDQAMQDVELLAQSLDELLSEGSLTLNIRRLSPFPEGKPKLIAAMVERNDALRELHRQVVASMNASPIEVDKRRFIPHITLGRFRHSRNPFAGGIPPISEISGEVDEVTLFESTLTTSGAEYEALFRFPLDQDGYELDSFEVD
jgi:2'-5' RNA ligase